MIVLVIVAGAGFFIFILYATVKTKSTSIEAYAPFNEFVGKTLTLQRETVLFREKMPTYDNSAYPDILLDNKHPRWQYIAQLENLGDIKKIVKFPAGTKFTAEKAVQYTNGVSGFSYPTIFGTVFYDGTKYKIAYQWGDIDISRSLDKIDKCWRFHQAPWQDKQDTAFYTLPKARFW